MPHRVFITYSHDSNAHRARVLALADRLRDDGIDVRLDQYELHVREGWQVWMHQQLEEADFVVFVCTETYRRRFEGKEEAGIGLGVAWEGALAQQLLYDAGSKNDRFIPLLFEDDVPETIPRVLRSATRYVLPAGYDDLYRHLTNQPKTPPPPLGKIRRMPPAPRPGLARGTTTATNSTARSSRRVGVEKSTVNKQGANEVAAPTSTAIGVAQPHRPTSAPSEPVPVYRWLHLSDLHLSAKPKEVYWTVLEAFERSLKSWIPKLGGPLDLLLLTGDLAATGHEDEYAAVDDLLARILDLAELYGGVRPLVVPVPGNHDLQRPTGSNSSLYQVVDRFASDVDDDAVKCLREQLWEQDSAGILGDLFPAYTAWLERAVLPGLRSAAHVTPFASFFPGDLTVTLDLPERYPLVIVGLNSAWSQYKGGDLEGRLHLPVEQFHRALPKLSPGASPLDLFKRYPQALLLQHHPRSWLTPPSQEAFDAAIYPPHRFTACLFGHMHEPGAINSAQSGGRSRTYYQAPSFFGLENYGKANESRLFGYTFGQLSHDGELRVWPLRALRKGDGAWAFDRDTDFHWSTDELKGVLLRSGEPPQPANPQPTMPNLGGCVEALSGFPWIERFRRELRAWGRREVADADFVCGLRDVFKQLDRLERYSPIVEPAYAQLLEEVVLVARNHTASPCMNSDMEDMLFRVLALVVLYAVDGGRRSGLLDLLAERSRALLDAYWVKPTLRNAVRAIELQAALSSIDQKFHRELLQEWLCKDARTWGEEQRRIAQALADLQRTHGCSRALRTQAFALYFALWRTGVSSPVVLRWLGALSCDLFGLDGRAFAGHVWLVAYRLAPDYDALRECLTLHLERDEFDREAGLVEHGHGLPGSFNPYAERPKALEALLLRIVGEEYGVRRSERTAPRRRRFMDIVRVMLGWAAGND